MPFSASSSCDSLPAALQAYTKVGLIRTREDKHSGDVIVTAVDRSDELYSKFRPYKIPSSGSSSSSNVAPGVSSSNSSDTADGSSLVGPLEVLEVYKVSRELKRERFA